MIVGKGQCIVLPYSVAKDLLGLRMILPGVKDERDQRPWWLGDYGYSNLNPKTLHIPDLSAMKYCRTLKLIIREVVIADPELGPMYVLKADVSEGF